MHLQRSLNLLNSKLSTYSSEHMSTSELAKVHQFFSFKHQGYFFLRVFRNYSDQKISRFYRARYNSWIIYSGISFFLTTQGKQITSRWTFGKGPVLNHGPSEKFLIVGHPKEDLNEREFKRQIIGRILDVLKKSSKTRERSIEVVLDCM